MDVTDYLAVVFYATIPYLLLPKLLNLPLITFDVSRNTRGSRGHCRNLVSTRFELARARELLLSHSPKPLHHGCVAGVDVCIAIACRNELVSTSREGLVRYLEGRTSGTCMYIQRQGLQIHDSESQLFQIISQLQVATQTKVTDDQRNASKPSRVCATTCEGERV